MSNNRTTELRKKLDERGVEFATDDFYHLLTTNWWVDGIYAKYLEGTSKSYVDEDDPTLKLKMKHVTPDQAIAATLGRPKVKKVRGMTYDEHGGEVYFLACSGCGDWVDGDLDCIGEYDGPNFCHNCGGEFDGPLMCKVCGELADMEFGDMCAECYWNEGEGNDD